MFQMDPTIIGIFGFVFFLLLLAIGTPVGIGMAVVGFTGIVVSKGVNIALNTLYMVPYSATSSWLLAVIPMFVLMGEIAYFAGFTKDAYQTAYRWVGRMPGGVAIATLMGAAAFGACSGSSVATTAALGKVSLPEMKKYGYGDKLAAGVVGMGGTLSALIPPSIVLVIYGVITEENIGKLLVAGIIPGLMTLVFFAILVVVWAKIIPDHAPQGESFSWRERFISLKDSFPILTVFITVTGGIYTGVFTPSEAGAVGALVVLVMSVALKRNSWLTFKEIIGDTLRVVSSIFLIVIGAYVFIQFLAITRLPINFSEWIIGLNLDRMTILFGIIVVYLTMGCFLDAMGLILLTVPFIAPTVFALGFDSIWFGVIVVKLVEIGLLTPPVGIQAYVLKGVAPDLPLSTIFKGFLPFFAVDLLFTIGLLIIFPQLATFLTTFM